MHTDTAETLALKGLARIAADPAELAKFLDQTGIDAAALRARAGDPELLAAIMDFILADDDRLTAFCEAEDLTVHKAHAIRHALPGANLG
jgi:hypothetical protein